MRTDSFWGSHVAFILGENYNIKNRHIDKLHDMQQDLYEYVSFVLLNLQTKHKTRDTIYVAPKTTNGFLGK